MADDLGGVGSISIGAGNLRLEKYTAHEEPTVKQGSGITALKFKIEAQALLVASSPADLETQLGATLNNFFLPGQDVILRGIGGIIEYQVLASFCSDGGPFITYTMSDGDTIGQKRFKLTIDGYLLLTDPNAKPNPKKPDKPPPKNSVSVKSTVTPDGLVTIERKGELAGLDTADYFLSVIFPDAVAAYAGPKWVVSYDYQNSTDVQQSKLDYTITAKQTFGAMPVSTDGNSEVVEGEITEKIDRDEQFRKVTTRTADLLIVGDPQKIVDIIRPTGFIERESVQLSKIKNVRLTASFTKLESASGDAMMNFSQTLIVSSGGEDVWEVKRYIGASPIVVKQPSDVVRVTQSGSATCLGRFVKPAPPVAAGMNLQPPQVTYEDVTVLEKRTSWNYVYAAVDANTRGLIGAFNFDPASVGRAFDRGFQPQLKTPDLPTAS